MVFFVVVIKVYNKFSDSPAPQQSFIFFNQRFLVSDSSTAYFFYIFPFLPSQMKW